MTSSHIRHVDAETSNLPRSMSIVMIRLPEELLDFDIFDSLESSPRIAGDLSALLRNSPNRPEQLDGRLRAHPGNQFIHPLLNRLADQKVGAGHPCQPLDGSSLSTPPWWAVVHWSHRMQCDDGIAFVQLLRIVPPFPFVRSWTPSSALPETPSTLAGSRISILIDCSNEILGKRIVWGAIVPSFRIGTNSRRPKMEREQAAAAAVRLAVSTTDPMS